MSVSSVRCSCAVNVPISEHFNHDGTRPKTLEDMKLAMTELLDESDDWELNHTAFESQLEYMKEKGSKALDQVRERSSQ